MKADSVRGNMSDNHLGMQIRQFILQKFPLARRRHLESSDTLLDSGILDSQGVLELVSFIEQNFPIEVADDELVPENFQSIDKLAAFVRRKTSNG